MRSSLSPKEFFHRMNKKAALKEILDKFDTYTVEQLDTIHGQPKWIRKVLVELKNDEVAGVVDEGAEERAKEIAQRMMDAFDQQEKQEKIQQLTIYEVRKWVGSDWLMSCGITGSMKAEVKYDACLYVIEVDPLIEKFIVGMDSVVGILTIQQWNRLLQNSVVVGMMTRLEYSAFAKKEAAKKMTKTPEERDMIAQTAGPSSYVSREDSYKGFKIIRHEVK